MQIERQIIITYRWWNNGLKEICPMALEVLDIEGRKRINEMMVEGFTSGELSEEIDGINYRGWWEMSEKTIQGTE